MRKILVTGANGFVGRHLVRELKARGHEVVGLGRASEPAEEIKRLLDGFLACDVTDSAQVSQIAAEEFSAVINLAGLASVGASFAEPAAYERVNVQSFAVLATHFLKNNSPSRLIAVSSGAVYDANQPMPLLESSRTISGGSPYAVSKLAMEVAARDFLAQGLDVVIVRPFNHIGPGQATGFLVPDLYDKILASRAAKKPLVVGNLASRRDYTDVRDIAKAYADLATAKKLRFDTYNLCSSLSRSGQEILDLLLSAMNLTGKIRLMVDQKLFRPDDPAELRGSFERVRAATGWTPVVPIEQTVRDFVDWRKGVS